MAVQSALNTVNTTGRSVIRTVSVEQIRHFIEAQPGMRGSVSIQDVAVHGDTGASSGIVRFRATYDVGQGPITRDLVLRHAPGTERRVFVEYDLPRQFKVQRAVHANGIPAPEPLWLDEKGEWLGVPGFVMASLPGNAPFPDAFTRGPIASATPEQRRVMLDEIMQTQVRIHRTDLRAAGLQDFAMNAPGVTALERCINWYWRTWEWARPPDYERLHPVRHWLQENRPEGEPELTHGDCTLHNYLFRDGHLTGVLDWEMSALGRAEVDLAFQCVGNRLFAAAPDSGLPLPPSEEEWLALYRKAGGRPLRHFDYFKKLAAYMILVPVCSILKHSWDQSTAARQTLLVPLWRLLES